MNDKLNTIIAELRTRLELLEEYKGTGYVPDMIRKIESNANRLTDELIKAREHREQAEREKGCEHCRGWDNQCGANYCPNCGHKLIGGGEE